MELNKITKRLLAELEDEIGSETYNPNSYDGWTGDEGCAFRYPITIPMGDDNSMYKLRTWDQYVELLNSGNVSVEQLREMRYKFGSNELYIGRGILNVLQYLEERYNLDFETLENEYRKSNSSRTFYDENDCDMSKEIKEHTLCIRRLSDEEKCYYSPEKQLIWVWIELSRNYAVRACLDDSRVDITKEDIIGVAKPEMIAKWKEKNGKFAGSLEWEIERYKIV